MANYDENNNTSHKLLEQRLNTLEENTKESLSELQKSFKGLENRVNNHDVALAKIELMVESLKTNWASLELTIRQSLDGQQESQQEANNNNTMAWKEVTIEAIKAIGIVAAAILAGKIFL